MATDSGFCEYLVCIDQLAINFDLEANTDNGLCEYVPWGPIIPGPGNHQIAIPDYADLSYDENPVSIGDWIGVFYTNSNNELVCGGAVLWNGITTNLAAWGSETGEDNGFQSGEQYTWAVYNIETGEIISGEVPAGSVVVPGTLPSKKPGGPNLYCVVIIKTVDEQTRSKTSLNELLRD